MERTHTLTNAEVVRSKAIDTLHDGGGLYMVVKTINQKFSRFPYLRSARMQSTMMGLCAFPPVTLADARGLRSEYLSLFGDSIAPHTLAEQATEQKQITLDSLFSTVAANWFTLKQASVTPNYAKDIWRSLVKDVFCAIDEIPVQEIPAYKLVKELKPIKARGAQEIARRLVQLINEIVIYTLNTDLININHAGYVCMAFEKSLNHDMPNLLLKKISELIFSLVISNLPASTRCIVKWQIFIIVHYSEFSDALWAELTPYHKNLKTPAEYIKFNRDILFLYHQWYKILLIMMRQISAHSMHIFLNLNYYKLLMVSQTAKAALKLIGHVDELASHGIRFIVSTTLNAHEFNPNLIKATPTHATRNEACKVINSKPHLKERFFHLTFSV